MARGSISCCIPCLSQSAFRSVLLLVKKFTSPTTTCGGICSSPFFLRVFDFDLFMLGEIFHYPLCSHWQDFDTVIPWLGRNSEIALSCLWRNFNFAFSFPTHEVIVFVPMPRHACYSHQLQCDSFRLCRLGKAGLYVACARHWIFSN